MGLTRLSKKCKSCPFIDKCDHKQLEALAYLNGHDQLIAEAGQSASMSAAASLLRETIRRVIVMFTDDFVEACRVCMEQVSRVFESLKEFADSINKSYKLPKKHFNPAKNRYKKCNMRNFYKVQQHLPYQRRNY